LNNAAVVASRLLQWHVNAEIASLSWRGASDPYAVLIAVLMLQHTTREQASKVFPFFMEKYPSAEALSGADEGELREMLRPLGLVNRRTKTLMSVARRLRDSSFGSFPRTLDELLELEGVGDYTASTILCIAFGQSLPIVDVNSARVIDRVFGKGEAHNFYDSAETDMKKLNLALLDFAHYVCTARRPKCATCPISAQCEFYQSEQQSQGRLLPVPQAQTPPSAYPMQVGHIALELNQKSPQ
jgi:A/G-specific adenine glycosylase